MLVGTFVIYAEAWQAVFSIKPFRSSSVLCIVQGVCLLQVSVFARVWLQTEWLVLQM
jgi:hypothetical protein